MPRKRKTPPLTPGHIRSVGSDTEVRIIGGTFRGRRLEYHGDLVVRPMKHRTREAIFNLISTECTGLHAVDLFAGTGALGLEALSRGATSATFIEKHVPSARVVARNIRTLAVEDRATLLVTSAFLWARRDLPEAEFDKPWLAFCSPPYSFYQDRQAEMIDLVRLIQEYLPEDSILIVEAGNQFDFSVLRPLGQADTGGWDVRSYPPAVVGIWRH